MKKAMPVFVTRPEAIKMCPRVNERKSRNNLQTIVCVTGNPHGDGFACGRIADILAE